MRAESALFVRDNEQAQLTCIVTYGTRVLEPKGRILVKKRFVAFPPAIVDNVALHIRHESKSMFLALSPKTRMLGAVRPSVSAKALCLTIHKRSFVFVTMSVHP